MARLIKSLGLGIAVAVVFFLGQVTGSLASAATRSAPHPVSIEIAGADMSDQGARKVEFSSGPIDTLQVCVDTCDDILVRHEADGERAHLRATDARGGCVICSVSSIGGRKSVRLGTAAGGGERVR